MSERKHTPGPWTTFKKLSGSENYKGFYVLSPDDWPLCDVFPVDQGGIECKANAHLIAAAPELLSELRLRCRQLGRIALACLQDHDGDARAIAEELDIDFSIDDGPTVKSEAIAKAEGKP